jgi:flagellar hook-associated protein 1 FlgK
MTSFAGLTNAAQALGAETYAITITGQNIANADTPGYTRERADLEATGPVTGVPRIYSTAAKDAGTVSANGATRLNDPVIDARARAEHAASSYLDTKANTLSNVESMFDEPTDNGLAEQLGTFWNDWSTVVSNPDSDAARNTVMQQGTTIANMLNADSTQLTQMVTDAKSSLSSAVDQMNTDATALGKLNAAITTAAATGAPTGQLQDQRDSVLADLAQLGGTSSQVQTDGTVTVTLGGQTLVSGSTANAVAINAASNVTVGGTAVTLTGGSAAAQVEAITTTLPGYQAQLDNVASALANSVNTIHETGYDLNGNAGTAFFSGTTAATIKVALTNSDQIAASSTGSGTADLDTKVAQQLAALGSSTTGADAAYSAVVSKVGNESSGATQQSAIQDAITAGVDAQQQSASGVSYDDEVTNLLAYQRAYQASSRVLTTIDDCLNTLINSTGRVGL